MKNNIDNNESLNLPFILRWLIIIISCVLVILIWLFAIPFWIITFGRHIHEFDSNQSRKN
jgi:hypothetical protein